MKNNLKNVNDNLENVNENKKRKHTDTEEQRVRIVLQR